MEMLIAAVGLLLFAVLFSALGALLNILYGIKKLGLSYDLEAYLVTIGIGLIAGILTCAFKWEDFLVMFQSLKSFGELIIIFITAGYFALDVVTGLTKPLGKS